MGVTLADAKEWLGLQGADTLDDDRLTQILSGVKKQVDQFCGVPLVAVSTTQRFEGGGTVWYLDRRPVKTVTSILDPAGNSIPDTNYVLIEELGILESYGCFPRAVRAGGLRDRWTVTYTAGHFDDEASVAPDAANAILDLVADYYHKAGPDVQSQKAGIENVVSYIPNPNARFVLPPRVQVALSPYCRRSV